MAKDEIVYVKEGDIKKGGWFLEDCKIWRYEDVRVPMTELKKIYIDLNKELVSLDLFSSDDKRTAGGTGAAGLVGLAVAGPLGAMAGMLLGGAKKNETVVMCHLSKNRMFLAEMDVGVYTKLCICLENNKIVDKQKEVIDQKNNTVNNMTVTSSVEGNEVTKECPMCAETIKEKAKICRFCRYEFPENEVIDNSLSFDVQSSSEIGGKKEEKLKTRLSIEEIKERGEKISDFLLFESSVFSNVNWIGEDNPSVMFDEIVAADRVHDLDESGNGLFHYACYNSKYNAIARLIKLGVNVNTINNDGDTALHYMMYGGSFYDKTPSTIQIMFDNGFVLVEDETNIEDAIIAGLNYQIDYVIGENLVDVKLTIEKIIGIIRMLRQNGYVINENIINEYLHNISNSEFKIDTCTSNISDACN